MIYPFAIFIFHEVISNKLIKNISSQLSNLYSYVNLLKNKRYYVTIQMLPPLDRQGKGAYVLLSLLVSFGISVMASIVAYYICKWLDRDR